MSIQSKVLLDHISKDKKTCQWRRRFPYQLFHNIICLLKQILCNLMEQTMAINKMFKSWFVRVFQTKNDNNNKFKQQKINQMKNGDQLLCSIAENTSATENWKGDKAH